MPVALMLAGCPSNDTAVQAPLPLADVTLRIAAPADSHVRAMIERHGRIWTSRTGAKLEIVDGNAAADVRILLPTDVGRLAPRLAPLNLSSLKGHEGYEFSRLLRYQVERNMDWAGQPIALPLMGESLVCVYRNDLQSNPRHAKALEARFRTRFRHGLRPTGPATWQEVAEIADYFANEPAWIDNEKVATPRPSLTPLPASVEEFDRDVHAIAASFVRRAINQETAAKLTERQKTEQFFTYHFNPETGEPAIESPGFVAALELMQKLQANRPKESAARPLEAFRSGQAVVALATLGDLAWLQEKDSAVRNRFGICRVPGSDQVEDYLTRKLGPATDPLGNLVPYHGHGGWLGAVDVNATNANAALDLLSYLSSPSVSLEIVCEPLWGAGPTRSSHVDNASGWHNYGLDSTTSTQLVSALDGYYRPALLNPVYRLRIANHDAYLTAFNDKVRPALTGGKTAAAALSDAAKAWTELTKDRAALAREYRQSQGLR